MSGEKEIPVEWPSLKNLRDAVDAVFDEEIAKIASTKLGANAYATFVRDAKELDALRKIIAENEISPNDMERFVKGITGLMKIDS